jgi:2-polyprenyl-3-methyl-5-hydroxy-6-metoxy-1,4-benzoquinol methylase
MDNTAPENPWDEHADSWDEDPGPVAYTAAAFQSLVDMLAKGDVSLDGAVICDFGCGTGLLSDRMSDQARRIDAVDTSEGMLAVLAGKIERSGVTNIHPSTTLPNSVGTHDLVVCSSVLGFVPDYPETVRQLAQLLRPGGLFVQWDWERDETGSGPQGLSRAEISDALSRGGLANVEVEIAFEVTIDGTTMQPVMGVGYRLN